MAATAGVETTAREVLVIPAFGKGHLFPCIQLCHQLASRGVASLLAVFCTRAASIPPSLHHHPLIQVAVVGSVPPAGDHLSFFDHIHSSFTLDLETLISSHHSLLCAILDDKMDHSLGTLRRLHLPVLTFFTSGAAAAALELSTWKFTAGSLLPGETRPIPGLPPHLSLSLSDLARPTRPRVSLTGPAPPVLGYGHHLGDRPSWLPMADSSIAFLVNTCDSVEHHYLNLLRLNIKVPVLEIGPLLPETFWCTRTGISPPPLPEEDSHLLRWLDSKPVGSVLYVSFGTEVGPRLEEYPNLAAALCDSDVPFIWVLQPGAGRTGVAHLAFFGIEVGQEQEEKGYYPHGLEERIRGRGVVVRGWAPQAAVLSHGATGGFLSHCGWNSTVEAMVHGVPLLAWPIRGDQYPNSKLVVRDLRVGRMVREGGHPDQIVEKAEIERSIRGFMEDGETRGRAKALATVFENGFPKTSAESIDTMCELVKKACQCAREQI